MVIPNTALLKMMAEKTRIVRRGCQMTIACIVDSDDDCPSARNIERRRLNVTAVSNILMK